MKELDYLIIGQGIAGSLLAHFLIKKGKTIKIIDQLNPCSSSRVAAGIFNPITGRRFVKTWKADEIFPFAEKTYREIEQNLNSKFYNPKAIVRVLSSEAELKEWEKKSKRPEYTQYFGPISRQGETTRVEILKGGYVDLLELLNSMRENFLHKDILLEEEINYKDIKLLSAGVSCKNYRAGKIIFCEGINAIQNPWFGYLPFTHAKGEILTIKSEKFKQNHILSKGLFVLPVGENVYKIGSTYDWNDLTEVATENAKNELIEKLEKLIKFDYTIIDHQAGIRPTVKDRRPLIGIHSKYSQLAIFNGLGTKGVSMGPFFASQFVDHLENGQPLDPEADIKRFDQ